MRMILNNTMKENLEHRMSATALIPNPNRQLPPAKPADFTLPLSELRDREARVVSVSAETDDAVRLMALGICVGRRVEVVQAGDPMIVRVVGARVGLSARLAAHVFVAVDDAKAAATTAA
jgi:Fe2+ transport system protein FeoA